MRGVPKGEDGLPQANLVSLSPTDMEVVVVVVVVGLPPNAAPSSLKKRTDPSAAHWCLCVCACEESSGED